MKELRAGGDLLVELLNPLSAADWFQLTPAERRTVRHEVAHLSWTDRAVLESFEAPTAFAELRERFAAQPDVVDRAAWRAPHVPPPRPWAPADAAHRVTGPALDFALLASRRRHRQDCAVTAAGSDAEAWPDIVQAYAGPAGTGREPRSSMD